MNSNEEAHFLVIFVFYVVEKRTNHKEHANEATNDSPSGQENSTLLSS